MNFIHDLFTTMIDQQDKYFGIGLCAHVQYTNSLIQTSTNCCWAAFIKEHLPDWYSGNPVYPIKHNLYPDDPELGYNQCSQDCGNIDTEPQIKHEMYLFRRRYILQRACNLHYKFSLIPDKNNPTKCVLIYNE